MDASTRTECLPGTRTDILRCVLEWVSSTLVEQPVLWLHGLAGSGKSTLSTTIAHTLQEQNHLGAFVFFDRDVEERSRSTNVIRTLAHQLASFNPLVGKAIAGAIDKTPRITQSALRIQFKKLLTEPLYTLPAAQGPIVLILDALDECGTVNDRQSLLDLLATESAHLPPFVRMIITSRAEFDIRCALGGLPHILMQELELTSSDNMKDISTFFRIKLSKICSKNMTLRLAHDWPGDSVITALNERAAGLFVWASTACRFIDGYDPRRNLDVILRGDVNTKAESAIDALYRTALELAVGDFLEDDHFRTDFSSIMGTILAARNPISDKAIDTLLSLERPSRHIISRLSCVLCWSETEPVRILHPSFADFLSNRLRCGLDVLYIDTSLHNRFLAIHCLSQLDPLLRRNICNLKLTSTPVEEALSEVASYACTSWIDHICIITEGAELVEGILEQFLFRHLLHWLEAMSLLKKSRTAVTLVRRLLDWLSVGNFFVFESISDWTLIAFPTVAHQTKGTHWGCISICADICWLYRGTSVACLFDSPAFYTC